MPQPKPFDVDNWTSTAVFAADLDQALLLAHEHFVSGIGSAPYQPGDLSNAASQAGRLMSFTRDRLGRHESLFRTVQTTQEYDEQMGESILKVSSRAWEQFDGVLGSLHAIFENPSMYDSDVARTLEADFGDTSIALKAMTSIIDNAAQRPNDAGVRNEFKNMLAALSTAELQIERALDGLAVYTRTLPMAESTSASAVQALQMVTRQGIQDAQQTLAAVLTNNSLFVKLIDRAQELGESLSPREDRMLDDAATTLRDASKVARRNVDEHGHIASLEKLNLAMPEVLGGIDALSNALLYSIRLGEPLFEMAPQLPGGSTPNF